MAGCGCRSGCLCAGSLVAAGSDPGEQHLAAQARLARGLMLGRGRPIVASGSRLDADGRLRWDLLRVRRHHPELVHVFGESALLASGRSPFPGTNCRWCHVGNYELPSVSWAAGRHLLGRPCTGCAGRLADRHGVSRPPPVVAFRLGAERRTALNLLRQRVSRSRPPVVSAALQGAERWMPPGTDWEEATLFLDAKLSDIWRIWRLASDEDAPDPPVEQQASRVLRSAIQLLADRGAGDGDRSRWLSHDQREVFREVVSEIVGLDAQTRAYFEELKSWQEAADAGAEAAARSGGHLMNDVVTASAVSPDEVAPVPPRPTPNWRREQRVRAAQRLASKGANARRVARRRR